MACIKMELHKARLATSSKLRAEWEKRLENNSRAVDELNTNRQLWIQAGGPDPELLVSPTEIHIDQCSKAVEMLEKMLVKNGPKGGRASDGGMPHMRPVSFFSNSIGPTCFAAQV